MNFAAGVVSHRRVLRAQNDR